MTPEAALKSGVFPLPLCWTTIAERPRENARRLHWNERAGAPLCPSEARTLASKGAIIMAQRYLPDRVELLVRPVMKESPKSPSLTEPDRRGARARDQRQHGSRRRLPR